MRIRAVLPFVLFLALPLSATTPEQARTAARRYVASHQKDVVRELVDFAAIPNVASDGPNIERNAEALVAMFARRGVTARLLRVEGAPPVVVADVASPGAKKTIGFYAHYDGQPA